MRFGAPLPSVVRCDFYIRTDAASRKSVPSASTACSSARGVAYFCGLDNVTDDIRTFRCDRIVRAWRPSKAYVIPADFNLNDYLFFEFDFADRPPVAATFSFAPQTQIDMINGLTRGRGELAHTDVGWTGPLTCAILKPPPHFAWPTPWTA